MIIHKILFLLVIFLYFTGCMNAQTVSDSSSTIKLSDRKPAEIEFEAKVKETMSIGFAYCFNAEIIKVNRGNLKDSKLFITVVTGDVENYKTLSASDENTIFTIFCVHNKDNEEYSTTYVTGFVDSEKTSWKIIAIQKK